MGVYFCYRKWRTGENKVQSQEAQTKPETEDAVHDATAVGTREEVPREAVSQCRRTSWILIIVTLDGNSSELNQNSVNNFET